jgi:hypothetical protein
VSFIELVTRGVTRLVKGFIERVNGSRKGYLKRDLRALGVTRSMKLTPGFTIYFEFGPYYYSTNVLP